jgi:hypothetical protein
MDDSVRTYEPPVVEDLGSLVDVTAACQGYGGEDGASKTDAPFVMSSPDFGDPGFCF